MRKLALLVGNGINLGVGDPQHLSWRELLKETCSQLNVKDVELGPAKPFPLAFEEISARCRINGVSEEMAKRRVGEWAGRLQSSQLHRELLDLPAANVLTLNYDYALHPDRLVAQPAPWNTETAYSLFRRYGRVWHIHGEASAPRSILLGHDHYVRYAKRIQDYLIVPKDKEGKPVPRRDSAKDATSPFTSGETSFEKSESLHSWVDVFLRDDVYVIGAGLHFSEIILWWLLALKGKASDRLRYSVASKRWKPGRTVFFDISEKRQEAWKKARRQLLTALGVDVRVRPVTGGGWADAYRAAIAEVRDDSRGTGHGAAA